MTQVPSKLYHAAPECVLLNINDEGLKSHWGEIYAAESPAEALTFMWFRLLDHVHNEPNPLMPEMTFNVVAHNEIHIWEIDTAKTKAKLWNPGTDHSAAFFGNASSWAYAAKQIERKALTGCLVYTRADIEAATAQSNK